MGLTYTFTIDQHASRTLTGYTQPMLDKFKEIPGYAELIEFCGEFPRFHDAEILSLHLNRTGTSQIVIGLVGHTIRHVPLNGSVVTLLLEAIDDLELQGFSHQNVVSGMTLESREHRFEMKLWPSYGVSGTIRARKVAIQFVLPPSM